MAQAIITLISKSNKKNLKNWRPISFFCVDYKILTKIISNRLKAKLDHTISKEETCGIPNWSIFSNLFTIHELTHHSTIKKIKSCFVSADQEKAFDKVASVVQEKTFDKVDREFLYKIMEKRGY